MKQPPDFLRQIAESWPWSGPIALAVITPLLTTLIWSTVLSVEGQDWHAVAESDVLFARGLAKEEVKFGPEFMKLITDTVDACQPIPSKCVGLDEPKLRQIDLFCKRYCSPWRTAWSAALSPCEAARPPKWCEDGRLAAKHFELGPYFDTMTTAIQSSDNALERFNIIAIIAERITKKVLRDYPHEKIDSWVAAAVADFLPRATPDDAIEIGRRLNAVSFGRKSETAKTLLAYADRAEALDDGQRNEMRKLAAGLRERPD